jgi:hypothetical protein
MPWFFVLIPLTVYMLWDLRRSLKTTPNLHDQSWRFKLGLISFVLALTSVAMFWFVGIHARVSGEYPYYAPTWLKILRVGLVLALCAFSTGLAAPRGLRRTAIVSSVVIGAMWLIVATSE